MARKTFDRSKGIGGGLLLGAFAFVLSSELFIRATDLDAKLLRPLLYYQETQVEAFRASDNAELLFEPAPGASLQQGNGRVTINRLGYRDPERTPEKPRGTVRIFCMGWSNTFGVGVDDDDTYPRQLERRLNRQYPGRRFEVWNGGANAYVLAQMVERAEQAVREYDPDILIFQHANRGRRSFLMGAPFARFFKKNPRLYEHNLRFYPFRTSRLGRWLLETSATWRMAVIFINGMVWVRSNNPEYGSEEINERSLAVFARRYEGRVRLFLMPFYGTPTDHTLSAFGIATIDLFAEKNMPRDVTPAHYNIHPPSHVFAWYAKVMAQELESQKAIR